MSEPIKLEYGPDDWPRYADDATAERVARHLTRAAIYRSGEMEAVLPRLMDGPRAEGLTPDGQLYAALSSCFVNQFGVAFLLRAIAEKDPKLADELAWEFWNACEDGDSMSELLWEWSVAYGQDPQAALDKGTARGEKTATPESAKPLVGDRAIREVTALAEERELATHEFETTTSPSRWGNRVGWSCGTCDWTGVGLSTQDAARQEHARIAADIAAGKIPSTRGGAGV